MKPQNQNTGIEELTDKELIVMVKCSTHSGHIYSPTYKLAIKEFLKRFPDKESIDAYKKANPIGVETIGGIIGKKLIINQ